MGENTGIEWTKHSFNPWWGCARISPGCAFCYADRDSQRLGLPGLWRRHGPRRMMADSTWRNPLKWNRDAERDGEPARVLCASMADVFEDNPQVVDARKRLWDLIGLTPWLRWLLLTKRPENVADMVPWGDSWPAHVWLGTSVENQRYAGERIPVLLAHPAAQLFLSCEPLLGPVDLTRVDAGDGRPFNCLAPARGPAVTWVIAGGESGGAKARLMHPAWATSLRDQAHRSQTPFLFKQWGEWAPRGRLRDGEPLPVDNARTLILNEAGNKRGRAAGSLTNALCEFSDGSHCEVMERVGKKAAGRLLDGRLWNEVPQ